VTDPKPTHRVKANPTFGSTPSATGDYFQEGDLVHVPEDAKTDFDGDLLIVSPRRGRRYYIGAGSLEKLPTAADFPVGSRVEVAAVRISLDSGAVFFGSGTRGRVITGTVVEGGYKRDVLVRPDEGHIEQHVAPECLTLIPAEPEAEPEPVAEVGLTDESILAALLLLGVKKKTREKVLPLARSIAAAL
jgi:hypothetical protein